MKKNYLIVLLGLMMGPMMGWGQYVANDYQSNVGPGLLWTNAAHWRMHNGVGWNAYGADGTPSAIRRVYIQGGMSTNGSQTANELIIESGGNLKISAASTATSLLTVNNGGILQVDAALTNSGVFTVESGGRVNINYATASGIAAIWNGTENFKSGSTFEIQNWNYGAGNPNARLIQNPSIISANSTGGYYFGNLIISGNPSAIFVMSAGSQTIKLAENNFTSSALAGSSRVTFTNSASNVTIGGNLIVTSDVFSFAATTTGNPVATINGDIAPTGGTVDLNQNSSGAATSVIQLKGNLNIPAAATLRSTDGGCKIVFSGAVDQNVSIASNLGTNAGFEVASTSTAKLIGQNLSLLNASNSFAVLTGGTLDFNGFNILGAGDFVQNTSSALKITSAQGINPTGNNSGNLQNTGTRTYSQLGYFYFTGNSNPQSTGLAITTASTAKRIFIAKTNPTDVVNLTQSTGTTDQLTITNGTFVESPTAVITGAGNLNMSSGGTYKISVLATTVPQLGGTYTLTGTSTIELNGAGNQVLNGTGTINYRNLTFSTSGTKTLSSAPASVTGTVTVANTAVLDVAANTLGGAGTSLTMTGTSRYKTAGTGTKPDAQGTYTLGAGTTIEFTNTAVTQEDVRLTGVTYYNIDVSGSNVGNATLASTPINMQAGSAFTVKTGGTFNLSNTDGFAGSSTTSISSTNSPTITLEAGSTIGYNGAAAQTITNTISYQSLTITGNGTKTAPSTTLTVQGNMTKSGNSVFAHNNGEVLFNNTAAVQTFSNTGTTAFNFYNLTNSNTFSTGATDPAPGLNINGNLGVVRALSLSANSKLALNAGYINLKSTSAITAFVTEVPASAVVKYAGAGRFVVERYFGTRRAWRLMTAPLAVAGGTGGNTFFNSYQAGGNNLGSNVGNGTYISGGPLPNLATNGLDPTPLNNSSLKVFNQATGALDPVSNTRNLNISGSGFAAGTPDNFGFFMFVRGDRFNNPNQFTPGLPVNETTLRDTGKLQMFSYTFPGNNAAVGKLALIGNPYPSPVDFAKITKTGVSDKTWTWDPNINTVGGYLLFDGGAGYSPVSVPSATYTGTIGQTKIIQSKQAFFIETSDITDPKIIIKEADKDVNNNQSAYRPANGRNAPMLAANLYKTDASGVKTLLDGNLLQVAPEFSNEINLEDAVKLTNINENFGINNSKWLSLERRKVLNEGDTIQYVLARMNRRKYQLHFMTEGIAKNNLTAYAEDKFLKTFLPLEMGGDSYLDFEVNENAASAATDRFRIVFKKTASFTNLSAAAQENDIAVKWSVADEFNIKQFEVERSVDGIVFSGVGAVISKGDNTGLNSYLMTDEKPAPGVYYYRLKAVTKSGGMAYSEKVKVTMMNTKTPMCVFPNPITNGNIGLQFNSQAAGKYTVRLLNELGQTLLSKQLAHGGGTASYNIAAPAIAAGTYQLEVTSPAKKQQVIKVAVQ